MFKTKEQIHEDMLKDISDDYDKQEGSFIYDATKPAAIELEGAYGEIDTTKNKIAIENLEGTELENRINERTGIDRKPATKATTTVTVTGQAGTTINIGEKVATDTLNYSFTESKTIDSSGSVSIQVECDESGSVGNVPANTIVNFPVTIQGLTSVTNPNPVTNGFDDETDAALLERYYERVRTPATSGNVSHYKSWAKEVTGVGDAKVFPLWNGDNTVKVVIINSNKQTASSSLVAEVQNYIDPNSDGLGDGQAPIGAYTTVVSATALTINVSFTATKDTAYTDTEIQTNVENKISEYLAGIAFIDSEVSYAQIGYQILDADGVEDYTNLTVNGGTVNISINDDEVAVLGGVTIA